MAKKRKRKKLNLPHFLIFLLFVALITGGGTILGLVALSINSLPSWDEGRLTSISSTLIYDGNKNLIVSVGKENRRLVKIKDIPQHVQDAFIAIEDVRFYQHHGIDLRAIARAIWYNIAGRGIQQGASTITQQLVKLSFLTPERTLQRKIQEVILALFVESRYTKQEILEMYLNKIYFGEGAYGIQSAAQTYFNKDVSELDLAEGAFLAGLPKAPSLYSHGDEALARRNLVLEIMARYNFITQSELVNAKKEPLNLKSGEKDSRYPYPYFIDYVTQQLIERYGEEMVYKGGLRVYTTLDPQIQAALEKAFANPKNFPASTRDAQGLLQPQGAAVFLDPRTGYIKALVGGREHTHQLQWNRATMPPGRQPGSAFKPIIAYAPAIELKGMGPASVIDDIPVKYGNYSPRNYDNTYRGLVTMRTAVADSINVVAVRVLMEHVGLPQAINFARRLGITLDIKTHGPSTALGGLHEGVTPLQMAGAYAAFANDGIYLEPTAILRVEGPDGTTLEEYQPKPYQAMKPSTAFLITDMLKSVVESGTGRNARLNRPVAGKTGTSDGGRDLWFCGYTPELLGVVWIGYDKPKPMPHEYGGRYPTLIWRQTTSEALKDTPISDFRRPHDIVTATVDNKSGLLPGPNTPPEHMVTDFFADGTVPTKTDNTHVLVELCATSGLLASDYCPDRVTKIMIKLPYTVPDFVQDSRLRAPAQICTEHTLAPEPETSSQTDVPVLPEHPVEPKIPDDKSKESGETVNRVRRE